MKKTGVFIIALIVSLLSSCAQQSSELPKGPDAIWTLIVIGDSSMWELGKAFEVQIEEDVGVQVELQDLSNTGSAGEILEALKTRESYNLKLRRLPDVLEEAEVVVMVMFANPEDSIVNEHPLEIDRCFSSNANAQLSCNPVAFGQWIADLEAIWGEVLKLRNGKPAILRATDLYNPLVSPWIENDIFAECTECWENISEATRLAAETYNIPFLSRLDAYNGPDRTNDPREEGYIRSDGEHPSELMGQYTAELLSQMGYDPVSPP